ncbi:hypothetical protein KK083_17235 [Fulvivirgaceae bacterium PWU4]|uniref:DUF4843 domain-containing protein n=1 Tax=Chryseosolibacter histidini TaxID=2782349 RepID=A0AAP2DLQ0_9BACT|nr:hypothetical protein [Chryseosolibacter histidini]MBT1698640.1 hypothetical protein [Chryseosolibacter histidini]
MKVYKIYSVILLTGFLLVSCFDDREILFEDTQIEFEDAVMRARATGEIFPIISVTRTTGTPAYQINLIGRQLAQAADVSFSLDTVPKRLLNANTIEAQQGVHFTLNESPVSFPEQASVTNATTFSILPGFPAQSGKTALFIIKLDGNDKIKPAENFRRLGFRINLN